MYQKRRFPLLYIVIALTFVGLACGVGQGEDPEQPSVVINSPGEDSNVTLGVELTIVSTSFSKNGVSRVELRINGQAISADAPLDNPESHIANMSWTPIVEGAVVISIVAIDAQGNASDPAAITVRVVQPGEEPPDEPGTDQPTPADTEIPPPPADTDVPPTPTDTETPWPEYTIIPFVLPQIPVNIFNTDIVGMDIRLISGSDHVFTWYVFEAFTEGSSRDLDQHLSPDNCDECVYTLPLGKSPEDIIDIAATVDNLYYFYIDGTRSVGNMFDADKNINPEPFALPPGKSPGDIVGIACTCKNLKNFYYWFNDGTVTSGTSVDLDWFKSPYEYSLPPGKTPEDIVAIGIACTDDHVYVWYKDGTVSSGTSWDLDEYRDPQPYTGP